MDPRLPDGGGYEVCGRYDINPDRFGGVENVITDSHSFGDTVFRNNFFNVTIDGRLPNGI